MQERQSKAGNTSPDVDLPDESEKLFFEAMKHVTTLNTGSILLLVTLWEKLLRNPHWRGLIIVSLSSFGFSTLCSVSSMLQSARYLKLRGRVDKTAENIKDAVDYVALFGFVAGIITLITFALRNLVA